MFRPTPAATSRVRSPSKPRSAIWLKAAWKSACSRSSLRERGGCVTAATGLIRSIKHLIDCGRKTACRAAAAANCQCYARDYQEVGNVQSIARRDDAPGAGYGAGESFLPRQARLDANSGEPSRRALHA